VVFVDYYFEKTQLLIQSENIKRLENASLAQLRHAWQYCAIVTRQAAGNFYYAFIFLPRERRRGIQALYAFLRAGDDAADSEKSNKAELLSIVKSRLDLCYDGYFCDDLTLGLAHAIKKFNFPRKHFDDMFLGLNADLSVKRYESFSELRQYCYRVASTVGLLCLNIFDADTEKARIYAENLGIGMQLTNILRDLKEDFGRNRIYLPKEDLRKFGIDESEMFSKDNKQRLKELVLWEAERADSFYEKASREFPRDLRKRLIAASIMGRIYQTILQRIKATKSHYERIELSRREKLAIGYKVITESNK